MAGHYTRSALHIVCLFFPPDFYAKFRVLACKLLINKRFFKPDTECGAKLWQYWSSDALNLE